MQLLDKINKKLIEFNMIVTIESAVYNIKQRTLSLILGYENSKMLNSEIKDAVVSVLEEEFGTKIKFNIKYRKNFFDEDILSKFLIESFRLEHPIIDIRRENISFIENEGINDLFIKLDTKFKEFSENNKIKDFVVKLLNDEYKTEFNLNLTYQDNLAVYDEAKQESSFDCLSNNTSSEVVVEDMQEYIGELIDAPIFPIGSYLQPEEGVVICGKVQNLKENKTKAKIDENGKERAEREYYTFELVDYSGSARVVYFPGKANLNKFKKIVDGSEIVIFGNLEDDKFSAGLSVRPKVINLCVLPKGFFDKIYSKPVPKAYSKIKPVPYESTMQENLFITDTAIKNPYLLENSFVVFDLETTGTNYTTDKIIEIGAVKVEKGIMTETFSCLVNPERHIPEDASKVNNIYDEDVKDAYTLKEVMPDFFKFCDGSIMVSYVIGFDFNFIDYNAKSMGYTFTNKTDDAFVMAKTKLKGLKNYKLTTVAKHMGVSLENAHRAVHDTIATAEVMIKLLENF